LIHFPIHSYLFSVPAVCYQQVAVGISVLLILWLLLLPLN